MEIINLYETIPKKDKDSLKDYPMKEQMQIELPFRLGVIGTSSSRKTNWVLNIVKHFGIFQEIHIIAKIIDEQLYEYFKNEMEHVYI